MVDFLLEILNGELLQSWDIIDFANGVNVHVKDHTVLGRIGLPAGVGKGVAKLEHGAHDVGFVMLELDDPRKGFLRRWRRKCW